jgi:hypothetical protein
MKNLSRLLLLLILSSSCCQNISAQTGAGYTDFNQYTPLNCSGEIPEIFLQSAESKYKADVQSEKEVSTNKYVSRDKGEFLFQSNYFVDELLQSGKVLFGDSVTLYINQVADRVLINEPDLRNKLSFYALRSEEPNAFSTDQGIIFVTLGLIAQLENEAQLAFILSHEISHFEKRHTLNVFIQGKKTFRSERDKRAYDLDEKIRAFSNHEKNVEFEADSLGLARLAKTGYACDQAITAMFVLQFSHLPFEDYQFNSTVFQRPMMIFPTSLFLTEVKPIKLDGDSEDDTYSSHPNLARRRESLQKQLDELANPGTEKFAASELLFNRIRTICRFEVLRLEIVSRNYARAIYDAQFLQKEFPASVYLKRAIAKSLYTLAKYKNGSDYNSGMDSYSKIEGNQQQCYFLWQKMSAEQITAVALRELYDLSLRDSTPIISAMLNDLGTEATGKHKMTMGEMRRSLELYNEALADTVKKDTAVVIVVNADTMKSENGTTYVSKYDKLRKEKKEQEKQKVVEVKTAEKSKFNMLAFADILDDPKVIAYFNRWEQQAEQELREEEEEQKKYDEMSSYEKRKGKEQEEKANIAPPALGVDTLLVIDPYFFYATEWAGYKVIESERGKYQLCSNVNEVATAAELPIVMLSVKEFVKTDVAKYNALAVVNEWLEESFNHDDAELLLSECEFTEPVSREFHTKDIFVTGVFTFKEPRENRGFIIFYSIICYPLLPFGIAYALTPEHETYIVSGVFDLNTGQNNMARITKLKAKAKGGYVRSQMYDIFSGIQKEPGDVSKNKTNKR